LVFKDNVNFLQKTSFQISMIFLIREPRNGLISLFLGSTISDISSLKIKILIQSLKYVKMSLEEN